MGRGELGRGAPSARDSTASVINFSRRRLIQLLLWISMKIIGILQIMGLGAAQCKPGRRHPFG
jgi:hypothetical protein